MNFHDTRRDMPIFLVHGPQGFVFSLFSAFLQSQKNFEKLFTPFIGEGNPILVRANKERQEVVKQENH